MGEAIKTRRGLPQEEPLPWGDSIPYYWEGEEFEAITGGWLSIESTYSFGRSYSEATKQANNFYQEARTDASASNMHSYFITEHKISLSGISKLKIDWQGTGTTGGTNGSILILDSYSLQLHNPNPITRTLVASLVLNQAFDETSSLDVGSLHSTYYIAIRCSGENNVNSDMILRTFKIWGE